VKAGKSAIVSLEPTKAAQKRLAAARSVPVRESVRGGSARSVRYRRLKIVQ
jgi:hypothetical protein